MPDNFIKSADIRPKLLSDEDKKINHKEAVKRWQDKKFTCSICGKKYKNNYKYIHKKYCSEK